MFAVNTFAMKATQTQWFIGCSGFHYPAWKEVFYPKGLPQRKWLEYYCSQFNTLELNVTFYRFPQLSFLQKWYAASPDNFLFSVKVPRLITHYKQFNDTQSSLNDFYATVKEGLQHKLGCVLFQLPGSIAYSPDLLNRILLHLEPSFTNVIEFRHQSWWNETVLNALRRQQVVFCGMSYPKLPDGFIATTTTAYYRFHGIAELYRSAYTTQFLQRIGNDITATPELKRVFLYFNNTMEMSAINNARYMQQFAANAFTTA